jgi:Transposase DDE domain group 1
VVLSALLATVTFNTEPLQHVGAALLRPGTGAATWGVRGLLHRLVAKLRTLLPRARLRVRADAGFAEAKLFRFLDRTGLEYVLGLPGNRRLDKRVRRLLGRARTQARTTGETATLYGETRYAARRWDRKRRIIMKAEVLCYPGRSRKDNPRFLVQSPGPLAGVAITGSPSHVVVWPLNVHPQHRLEPLGVW